MNTYTDWLAASHWQEQEELRYVPPSDYPTLFSAENDAYHMGIADRDLGLPSHSHDYSDRDERAAYVAGRCAAKRVLSVAEMLAELETLREAMDDEDFWRLGC